MLGKKILASVLLVTSLASIFFMPLQANAQSPWELAKISGFTGDIIGVSYDDIRSVLWVMTSQDTGSFRIGRAYSVSGETNAILASAVVYNETNTNNALYDFACNYPYCYFSHGTGSASTPMDGEIYRFSILTNTPTINLSVDKTVADNAIDYTYLIASRAGSFGGTTLIFPRSQGTQASTVYSFYTFDGLIADMDSASALSHSLASGLASVGRNIIGQSWSQLNAPNNDVAFLTSASGAQVLYYWSLDSNTLIWNSGSLASTAVGSGVYIDSIDYGTVYVGRSDGSIVALSTANGNQVDIISNTETGLSNTIFDMTIVTVGTQKYLVARDVGSGGNISWLPWNGTGFSSSSFLINSQPASQQGDAGTGTQSTKHPTVGRIANGFNVGKMYIPMTNTDRAVLVINIGVGTEGFDSGAQFQPAVLPENSIVELNGLFLCMGGFVNVTQCDPDTGMPVNSDPKTNGTGLAFLLFIIIVSYAFLVYVHYQTRVSLAKDNVHLVEIMNIHPILLVIMLIADFGFVWYLGWLSDIIFYTMIVAVVGLGALGFYGKIRGSS